METEWSFSPGFFLFIREQDDVESSDSCSIPDDLRDFLALRDSPTPLLCITDDSDVIHSPVTGTPIHSMVRFRHPITQKNIMVFISYLEKVLNKQHDKDH